MPFPALYTTVFQAAVARRHVHEVACDFEEVSPERLGGFVYRFCRDARARARESPRVVGRAVRIGKIHYDGGGAGIQNGGRDLPLRVYDAVAELGGADGEVVGLVRQKRHVGLGAVLGGRGAILGMCGDPLAFQPVVALRFLVAPAAREGLLYKVEALIEAVARDDAVVRRRIDVDEGIVGSDDVLPPHRERVDAQFKAQLVDGRFDGEGGLRRAVST